MLFILLSPVSLTATFVETAPAKESYRIDIRVLIENIKYNGNDEYTLLVSMANASPMDIMVRIIEEGFFVQTDRGWMQLKINGQSDESGEFLLPRDGKHELAASINIPLTIPRLFRTYDGDISLMYKYKYAIWAAAGTGAPVQRGDEVYCWVTPGTSQWILREGM